MLAIQTDDHGRQRHQPAEGKYRELIGIAEEVNEATNGAPADLQSARQKDIITDLAIAEDAQGRSSTFVTWEPV